MGYCSLILCRLLPDTRAATMTRESVAVELIGERAGNNISFWERSAQKFRSASLHEGLCVDVCVVGAGIAGMTTAYLLACEGRDVAIVDNGLS
jgi:NADPH-dependent 2,4-dienoyl-CoA reductase/sulfur reductase-like enzyme